MKILVAFMILEQTFLYGMDINSQHSHQIIIPQLLECVTFDNKFICLLKKKDCVKIYNNKGEEVETIETPQIPIEHIDVSPDKKYFTLINNNYSAFFDDNNNKISISEFNNDKSMNYFYKMGFNKSNTLSALLRADTKIRSPKTNTLLKVINMNTFNTFILDGTAHKKGLIYDFCFDPFCEDRLIFIRKNTLSAYDNTTHKETLLCDISNGTMSSLAALFHKPLFVTNFWNHKKDSLLFIDPKQKKALPLNITEPHNNSALILKILVDTNDTIILYTYESDCIYYVKTVERQKINNKLTYAAQSIFQSDLIKDILIDKSNNTLFVIEDRGVITKIR